MQRIILHCDLNNFFASATLSKNPTLKTLPVAVCGDAEKRHGIVLAKNTVAKRYGVVTAETIWEAKRKCPDLIILAPDFDLYEALSKKVQKIYLDYSDLVEPFGIDECWVDITNPKVDFDYGLHVANEIRCRVKKELDLTVSVGVSYTKTLAKLGSDLKKPDAVSLITPEILKKKIWRLPCSNLLMVGRSTYTNLRSMGIFTIGDIANADPEVLKTRMGKNGHTLYLAARGEENGEVKPYHYHEKPKSIGHSATAPKDITTNDEVFSAFLEFAEGISRRLRAEDLLAGTVIMHYLTNEFEGREYRMPLKSPTDLSMTIARTAMELFQNNNCLEKPLRAVGIRVVNLTDHTNARQLSFFDDPSADQTAEKIEQNILEIRNRYGKNAIKRASTIKNKTKPSTPGFYK